MSQILSVLLVGLVSFFSTTTAIALDDEKEADLLKVGAEDPKHMDKALLHQGVYFKNLQDGQTVPTTFKVEFGVHGMVVKPAGKLEIGSGHHHILINYDSNKLNDGFPENKVIPADKNHIHFGDGQTETTLTLPPGKHTLTLQFANGAHFSYGKRWAKTITVHVKK